MLFPLLTSKGVRGRDKRKGRKSSERVGVRVGWREDLYFDYLVIIGN